jgi:hypothetical protein
MSKFLKYGTKSYRHHRTKARQAALKNEILLSTQRQENVQFPTYQECLGRQKRPCRLAGRNPKPTTFAQKDLVSFFWILKQLKIFRTASTSNLSKSSTTLHHQYSDAEVFKFIFVHLLHEILG